jgi:hypothetical protein
MTTPEEVLEIIKTQFDCKQKYCHGDLVSYDQCVNCIKTNIYNALVKYGVLVNPKPLVTKRQWDKFIDVNKVWRDLDLAKTYQKLNPNGTYDKFEVIKNDN